MVNNELTPQAIRQRAQDVFSNHLTYLSNGDIDAWINLWDENGVIEFPYSPAGYPKHLEGKDAIYAYMVNFPTHFDVKFLDIEFHPTIHPELTIAEFRSKGQHVATGNPYNQTYISVVETKDGLITRYRDFWNPLVAIESFGNVEDFKGGFSK